MAQKNHLSTAERVAKILLEIEAVTLSPQNPYKFVSGIISPIYTDNRLLMGYPLKRKEITIYLANFIKDHDLDPEIIAGTSTAGIPPAAWLAELLNLPMIYVRSDKKDHGKGKLVEGVIHKGVRVLLIEDLISTGKSSLATIEAIRAEGGRVDTCLAFLDYGFEQAKESYRKAKVTLHTLSNLDSLVSMACKMKLITEKQKLMILKWRHDPWNWSEKMKFSRQHQTVEY